MKNAARLLAALFAVALVSTTGAFAGTQQLGKYTVSDVVTHNFTANTTTATYTVTVPSRARDLSHVSLKLIVCQPAHDILNITFGGKVESQDPATNLPGPVIKWDSSQKAGTTFTYSYTVDGLFAPSPTTIALKSKEVFTGTVDGIGCDPVATKVKIVKTDDTGAAMAGLRFEIFTNNGGAVGTATGKACITDAAGKCEIGDLLPGTSWVVETSNLPYHKEAAPKMVTLAQGETKTVSFTNKREFTKIVLVCHAGGLYAADVTEGTRTKTSLSGAGLTAEQQAALCDLGGASFYGNLAGVTDLSVDID